MEEHLYTLLTDTLSCPVKWGFFKDGEAMPRVTLFRMSGSRDHTLNSKGLMRGTVQIDCWGETYAEAITVSRQLKAALEGYRGGPILSAILTATRDSGDNDSALAQRVSLTFAMRYRE